MSLILAINAGINSSVGLFKDGKPVICVEEERFNRIKNWFGFPEQALQHLLSEKYFNLEKITDIAICDEVVNDISREKFYKRYEYHYSYGKLLAYNIKLERTKLDIKNKLKSAGLYKSYTQARQEQAEDKNYHRQLYDRIAKYGLDISKIVHVEHHLCHAASAYYGLATDINEPYLVFTLDGGGDNLRSTVSIAQNGAIERKSAGNEYSIGNMYSAITHHLGFRSHEHEYKLMGLAPYVDSKYAGKYKEFFEHYLKPVNDDTEFANPYFINHSVFFAEVIKQLTGSRFDNIAAGLQAFTEDVVVHWVRGNIRKYGIKKILCTGGVFMNVKLNMLLSQLPDVEYIDVFPSCGDESNIFGAAFYVHNSKYNKACGLLDSYTLGPIPSNDLTGTLEQYKESITVEHSDSIHESVAGMLSENMVVAYCSGNMEFGARALGNRSILANPSQMQNINKINKSVKKRDFWMPFAPAMLWEDANTMIEVPSSLQAQGSPYMMFAFDTKESMRDNIICGVHQADFTARAQTVTSEKYPALHAIIKAFKEKTGIPCLLNTSFNLHGYPIVANSEQAVEVLLNSEIDVLVIDNYIIRRKQ
ncbi:MAG TPA: carbamoyltransferase C-terminal domain-containing protein [Flavipsychrobacter sp.]